MANGTVPMLWDRYQKKSGWLKEDLELRRVGVVIIFYTPALLETKHLSICKKINFPPQFVLLTIVLQLSHNYRNACVPRLVLLQLPPITMM